MHNKQYVVLGLGVFGTAIVKTLSQFGCEVLAIDKDSNCVQNVAEFATKAVIGDITDLQLLKDLGLQSFDVGVVAIGDHLEECLLGVLNLKELGVSYVIAKAKNERFQIVLEKIGAHRVIRPEKEMGKRVARSLLRKNIIDMVDIDDDYSLVEIKAPQAWIGKTLADLNLRKLYGINVLAKRHPKHLQFFVDPQAQISSEDQFLLIAKTKQIERFDYLIEK